MNSTATDALVGEQGSAGDVHAADLDIGAVVDDAGMQAEEGVGKIMQQQPTLAMKTNAIKRYADEVIARFV